MFGHVHAFYPFEGYILKYALAHPKLTKQEVLNALAQPYAEWLSKVTSFHKPIHPILLNERGEPLYGVEEIRADLENSIANLGKASAILEFIYTKCDIFGMGLLLGELFRKFGLEAVWDTTTTPSIVRIRLKKPPTTHSSFFLTQLDGVQGLTDEQRTYLKELCLRVFNPLFNLVAGMTNPLLRDRIGLDEAIEKYTKLLKHARRLLTQQNIETYLIPANTVYRTLIQHEEDERRMLSTRKKLTFNAPTQAPPAVPKAVSTAPLPKSIGLAIPLQDMPPPAPIKRKRNVNTGNRPFKTARRKNTPIGSPPKPSVQEGI
jgi:hypothetical protein